MANILDAELLYLEYLENGIEQRNLNRRNDFQELSDQKFIERYRLSKAVVVKVLQEIENRLTYNTNRNLPLSPMQQLLIALRFYATGTFQITIGDISVASKATVCRIVHKVSAAIAALRPRYIVFPQGEERLAVIQKFYNIAHFPGCLGAIDCTHIKVQSPGGNIAELYRGRKQYFSVNVQTVCDSELLIRNIVARWPGSVHDSTIFNHSRLRAQFEAGEIAEGMLLGDNGYPLRKYLLTPLLQPQTRAEVRYNRSHIRTRNCIERMYGIWKRRFPVLSMGLRVRIQNALTIIIATAVLHNIAIQTNDIIPPADYTLHEYFAERI